MGFAAYCMFSWKDWDHWHVFEIFIYRLSVDLFQCPLLSWLNPSQWCFCLVWDQKGDYDGSEQRSIQLSVLSPSLRQWWAPAEGSKHSKQSVMHPSVFLLPPEICSWGTSWARDGISELHKSNDCEVLFRWYIVVCLSWFLNGVCHVLSKQNCSVPAIPVVSIWFLC